MAAYVAGRDGLTGTEVDAWQSDLHDLGPEYFFSINRYVFCAVKPA
jgi:hypothetical protein